jgi:hypothetical protein
MCTWNSLQSDRFAESAAQISAPNPTSIYLYFFQYEIQQLTSAVQATTENADEVYLPFRILALYLTESALQLSALSLEQAATILDVITAHMNDLTAQQDPGLAQVAVKGASNVLLGVQLLSDDAVATQQRKFVVTKTEEAVQKLLKVCTRLD